MSTRTSVTVREQGLFPELGTTTKTFENCDVALGNKMPLEEAIGVVLFNSAVASRTITITYDDDAGQVRTNILTLGAGEVVQAQFPSRLGRHAADLPESNFVWFTASGTAGDVKMQAQRRRSPLN